MLSRIDDLPENVLDALAWQYHADYYDLAADISMKREHVKSVLKLHQKKGTAWAIREALRLMDIDAEFVPWWQTGDPPYTFRLKAVIGGDYYKTRGREALMPNLRRAVNDAKSARSYMTQAEAFLLDDEELRIYSGVQPSLSGSYRVKLLNRGSISGKYLSGTIPLLSGNQLIRPSYPEDARGNLYAGMSSAVIFSISISPDIDTVAGLLKGFEERICLRIDLCRRNIELPVLNMHGRLQVLEDFIHDMSPRTFAPSFSIGVLPMVSGYERVLLRHDNIALRDAPSAGVLPLVSGNIAVRSAKPETPEGTHIPVRLVQSSGYGMLLRHSPDEILHIRRKVYPPPKNLDGTVTSGMLASWTGDRAVSYEPPETPDALKISVSLPSAYGMDLSVRTAEGEMLRANRMLVPLPSVISGEAFAGVLPVLSGNQAVHADYPDSGIRSSVSAGTALIYGLDVLIGLRPEELREIRGKLNPLPGNIAADIALGSISLMEGSIAIGTEERS